MDLIKRKLELIDFKLELGPAYLIRQIVESAPLVLSAVAIILGILIQQLINFPFMYWLPIVSFSAAFVFLYIILNRQQSNLYLIFCLAFICSLSLGAIRLNSYRNLADNDISNIIKERTLATIRGIIISQPYISDSNDWVFYEYRISEPSSSFYMKLT